jgi:hypothetical protein
MQKKLCIYSNITTYLILACKTNLITNKTNCYNKAKSRIVFLYITLQAGVNFDWLGFLVCRGYLYWNSMPSLICYSYCSRIII